MDILTIIGSIVGGLVIPSAILYFAIKSYRLKKDNQNVSKFDDRKGIYDAVTAYISAIHGHADFTYERHAEFLRNSRNHKFLFGDDVHRFIDEIIENGRNLCFYVEKISEYGIGEEKDTLVGQKFALIEWFKKQYETADVIFGKYLKVDG